MALKKYFLLTCSISIAIIGLIYGAAPQWFAQTFLDMPEIDGNFAHVLRAVMGIYLAFGGFWLYAAFNSEHQNTALLTGIILVAGLIIGRVISMLVDGRPSAIFVFYLAIELVLLPVAYWFYKQPS